MQVSPINNRPNRTLLVLFFMLTLPSCSSLGLSLVNSLARLGDIEHATTAQYGDEALQAVSVYRPKGADQQKARPVVVFFYGGCWGACTTYAKERYLFVAEALTSAGFIAVIADYRRYPEVTIEPILADAAAAVEWTAEHIANYGGDPEKLFLMGHSAGAHLAAMLHLDEPRLSAQTRQAVSGFIGLAGPYDFLPFQEDYQKSLFGPPQHYKKTQPIHFVTGQEAPMLLLWGDQDSSVYRHNLVNLAAKIEAQNGQVSSHILEGVDHVGILSALSKPFRKRQAVMAEIEQFIQAQKP